MENTEFFTNFADLLEDTSAETLNAETKFRELDEWSSLTALSVIGMADEAYGVTLTGEDIRSAVTLGDLFQVIQNKK